MLLTPRAGKTNAHPKPVTKAPLSAIHSLGAHHSSAWPMASMTSDQKATRTPPTRSGKCPNTARTKMRSDTERGHDPAGMRPASCGEIQRGKRGEVGEADTLQHQAEPFAPDLTNQITR